VIAYLSRWIFDQRRSSLYVIKIVRHETAGFGQELARSVETLKKMPPYLRWRLLESQDSRVPVKAKCGNKVRLSAQDAVTVKQSYASICFLHPCLRTSEIEDAALSSWLRSCRVAAPVNGGAVGTPFSNLNSHIQSVFSSRKFTGSG
jgi:hypothetical protein